MRYVEKDTSEVKIPDKLIEQVIGQDKAVEIMKKVARQKRHVLLIGLPGTGKSMLAQAMSEMLPAEDLEDVLIYPNRLDENNPKVRVVKTYNSREELKKKMPGRGRRIIEEHRKAGMAPEAGAFSLIKVLFIIVAIAIIAGLVHQYAMPGSTNLIAAGTLGAFILIAAWLFVSQISKRMAPAFASSEPKLIVDNSFKETAPFNEATGSKAGALFGDVKHDPLQSGGLGTPAHLRVEAGAIHRAHKGVLFIDEVSLLSAKSQQDLLSAMQNKKFPITGQSETSSGALVRTDPVPCDFLLVAAGNMQDVAKIHPALRSRIKGYGYEVYMEDTIDDTPQNRRKFVQFIAQEVNKDGKIPHFSNEAVEEIINFARRMAGRKGKLTLKMRDLGGLIRAAGDIAVEQNAKIVEPKHIIEAKKLASPLEQQLASKIIDFKKEYEVFANKGVVVGKVNGLAVVGDGSSGIVLPIEAQITPASSRQENRIIATGKLGEIAREAVENVSAIIKKHLGSDIANKDIHIQFLQTYEGVEGDSASISIATAVFSAFAEIPIRQNIAMTGSLSVRGEVLPVGGVSSKVEAAIETGMKVVIVPYNNKSDIVLSKDTRKKIKIIPVKTFREVLEHALHDSARKKSLLRML